MGQALDRLQIKRRLLRHGRQEPVEGEASVMNLRMSLKVDPDSFETLRRFSAFLLGQRHHQWPGGRYER